MCSFLFGVIFLGAAAAGILTGDEVSVCEDVPSVASLLQMENTLVTMEAQCIMKNRFL